MVKRIIKGYMKDDAKLNSLVKRATATIRERHLDEVNIDGVECPSSLSNFIQPIMTKVREVRGKVEGGEAVLQDVMQNLSDEQVQSLLQVFSKTTGAYTEDRLLQTCYLLFKEMSMMEDAICHINNAKHELVSTFILAYAKAFNTQKSAGCDMRFNNEAFVRELTNLKNYRAGVRSSIEQANASEPSTEQEARCCLM